MKGVVADGGRPRPGLELFEGPGGVEVVPADGGGGDYWRGVDVVMVDVAVAGLA